jgi:hypothetical protein
MATKILDRFVANVFDECPITLLRQSQLVISDESTSLVDVREI